MKTKSFIRPAVWAGVITAAMAGQALAQSFVYVPMGAMDEVLKIDTAKDEIVGSIADVPVVHGLAETPDGKFLIAGSIEQRKAGSAAAEKPAGMAKKPDGMAKKPMDMAKKSEGMAKKKHKMKMSDGMKEAAAMVSTVSVISIADAKVVRTIEVPGAVHHVAVSPNGRFAVVTHPKKAAISAIDLTSYKVVATVPTGPMPNYAVFSPDGASVYVSNAGNNTISQVATAGWAVQASIGVGGKPEHIVLSGDGATLYVSNIKSGTVSVVSAEQRKVVNTYQIGGKLHGLDLSDDGKTLFVAARGMGKLARVDLATGTVSQSELSPSPYHLAAVRGTGKLYISSGEEPKMWVVDQKTNKVLKEIPIGGRGHQLAQSVGG